MPPKAKPDTAAYQKLKKDIKEGSIGTLYVFHGEEAYLRDFYLGQLKKKLLPAGMEEFNLHTLSGKEFDVKTLAQMVDCLPMMSERTLIVVNDYDIYKGDKDALAAVLRELPDKLETVVYSRMEEEQKNLYAAGAAKLKERLDRSEGEGLGEERFQVLADLTRLRQICCDPRLCYENYKGGSAKLETCMDLVRRGVEGEHKILLFSQFTSMLELIENRLNQEGIASYKLTGATSKEERMRLVGEFASDATPVFLISLKAGGTGLNLTAADIVIHYDPWWNVAAQNQATDRSHRIGQDKQVTVFKLIARNTVEENILTLQESKSRLSDQVITGDGGSFGGLTREDILRILA